MKKNIVIIHYNTPHLTECLVRSINLFVKDAIIYIFDNSDKEPFTAEFDNVTVMDNTKGQIINFDEWLKNYPRRNNSFGKYNKWASAKHCYSVEKCMELIGENFLLLDSDVLLKKDISELIDDECMYVGETIIQPGLSIKRVVPYICYINVEMCKKNDVHYFNPNYMHGLGYTKNNSKADNYDTGAGFYVFASKFKHRNIEYEDYVVHYGNGSWKKSGIKKKYKPEEWLMMNKKYWSSDKKKKVIYTCITGGYDELKDPKYITDDFDYVCFTDNVEMKSDIWKIKPLPKECDELSQVKKQRYVKINAHKVLPEYDLSVWIDGSVTVKADINELLNDILTDDISIYVPKHPIRNCIYTEAKTVLSMKKDIKEIVDPQIERYKEEGFPGSYGLLQSNILIRKHNEEDCKRLMEAWFNELKDNSHRDQLSFNYVLWKNSDIKIKYLDKHIYKSKWFSWGSHCKSGNAARTIRNVVKSSQSEKVFVSDFKSKDIYTRSVAVRKELLIKNRKLPTYSLKIYS